MKQRDTNLKARADIEKYGWHCLNVGSEPGDERPGFSYTVGLVESFGHPEIAVFGLAEKAHGVLTECANLIRNGARFVPHEPNGDVLDGGYSVVFKPIREEHFPEYLGAAIRYYGDRSFDAFVLFWPNNKHEFPWETPVPGAQAEALSIV